MPQLTKAQEIERIIDKDRDEMNNAPYPEKLPEWLLDNFDEIVMAERQNVNKYSAKIMRSILSKKDDVSQLTMLETGLVLNMWSAVQPYLVAKDIDEFLDRKQVVGQLMWRYNVIVQQEDEKLRRKENTLINLSRSQIVKPYKLTLTHHVYTCISL